MRYSSRQCIVMPTEGEIGEHGIMPCRTRAETMYLSVGSIGRDTAFFEAVKKKV
jgi:hypothetical protein